MKKLYLAGGLFSAGERLHIIYLEKHLKNFGYEIILPQREALRFFDGEKLDLKALSHDCRSTCAREDVLYIGCIDGPDADSGTSIEYGIAITSHSKAIIYRTDFRTEPEKELGVNGMFNLDRTEFVYEPCYFTQLDQVEPYYANLAKRIHEAVTRLHTA